MAFLKLRAVTKSYATPQGRHLVLQRIDLAVEEGEFVAVVGYSGSGKTTLVSLIAGLIPSDAGEIVLDGAPVTRGAPERDAGRSNTASRSSKGPEHILTLEPFTSDDGSRTNPCSLVLSSIAATNVSGTGTGVSPTARTFTTPGVHRTTFQDTGSLCIDTRRTNKYRGNRGSRHCALADARRRDTSMNGRNVESVDSAKRL